MKRSTFGLLVDRTPCFGYIRCRALTPGAPEIAVVVDRGGEDGEKDEG